MTPIIKVLREDWADPEVALPAYETHGAAGADIRANLPPEIRDTGLVLAPAGGFLKRLLLPFRLVGITFSALFAFLQALLMLPARMLGWKPAPVVA